MQKHAEFEQARHGPADQGGDADAGGALHAFQRAAIEHLTGPVLGMVMLVVAACGRGKSLPPKLVAAGDPNRSMIVVQPSSRNVTRWTEDLRKVGTRVTVQGGDLRSSGEEVDRFHRGERPGAMLTTRKKLEEQEVLAALSGWAKRAAQQGLRPSVAIDEVHHAPWEVADLLDLFTRLSTPVDVMLLTGTPTDLLRRLITPYLSSSDGSPLIVQDPGRPVVRHDLVVESVKGPQDAVDREKTAAFLASTMSGPRVIYKESRKGCERIAERLRSKDVGEVHVVHGQTPASDRDAAVRALQEAGPESDVVVVATTTLGAGVDFPAIRSVILVDHLDPILSAQLAARCRRGPAHLYAYPDQVDVLVILPPDGHWLYNSPRSAFGGGTDLAPGLELLAQLERRHQILEAPFDLPSPTREYNRFVDDELVDRARSWLLRTSLLSDLGRPPTGTSTPTEAWDRTMGRLDGADDWRAPVVGDGERLDTRVLKFTPGASDLDALARRLSSHVALAIREMTPPQWSGCVVEQWADAVWLGSHNAASCATCNPPSRSQSRELMSMESV